MNKYLYIFFILILGCSLNSNSAFWTKTEKVKTEQVITKLLFEDVKPNEEEFNPKLKVSLPIKINKKTNYNFNNDGFTDKKIVGNNFSKFKFSKFFWI